MSNTVLLSLLALASLVLCMGSWARLSIAVVAVIAAIASIAAVAVCIGVTNQSAMTELFGLVGAKRKRQDNAAPFNNFINTDASKKYAALSALVHVHVKDARICNAFVGCAARTLIVLWYKPLLSAPGDSDAGILENHNPCESFIARFIPNMCR
jgi:hypothetical protein